MNPLRPILAALYALAELVGATLTELLAWLLEPAYTHEPRPRAQRVGWSDTPDDGAELWWRGPWGYS